MRSSLVFVDSFWIGSRNERVLAAFTYAYDTWAQELRPQYFTATFPKIRSNRSDRVVEEIIMALSRTEIRLECGDDLQAHMQSQR